MISANYKTWKAILDFKTCMECRSRHGKIYKLNERINPGPPLHPGCRCAIRWLSALPAGTATFKGNDGADWWLKHFGKLPEYYITQKEAKIAGWNSKIGNLFLVCPGKMLMGGIYMNKNGHLPSAEGRVWYEADINYGFGYRGGDRVLFSSDGLVFVTYDHYLTFEEIV